MPTTLEDARASLIRFIQEFNRYPTKEDCKKFDWLYSQQTYRRLLGPRNELTLLEEFGEKKEEEVIRYCKYCGKVLDGHKDNIFCNHSCAAMYNNPRKPPRKLKPKTKNVKINSNKTVSYTFVEQRNCLSCGAELAKRTQKLFCSTQCQADHRFKLSLEHWLETGEAPSNRAIRKYITELDGYKCDVCGISEWNGKPIVLEVEHKDGNSEDDSRENVCLICPNCHSQTDTYKGKNKGRGRHSRRQRYHDGKSY